MTQTQMAFVILIILVALVFDYVNGWHDAANSIATVVSTRVLSPGLAVIWAAFFNFVAFAIFGTRVAKTIGADLVNIKLIDEKWQLWVLLCALLGAIIWDVITWYYGLPSSSSHALVGGLAGAAIAAYRGYDGLLKPEGWIKTGAFIIVSPLVGFLLGFVFMAAILWIFRRYSPDRVDKTFRKGQLVSAALYSLGHGGNDAQKTMGIIAGVLVASNVNPTATSEIPLWVVLNLPRGYSARDAFGRVAYRPHDGVAHNKAKTRGGICRRDGRGRGHLHGYVRRHPRQHDSHHHGLHSRRRGYQKAFGRALGRGRPRSLGMGFDHTYVGSYRRALFPARSAPLPALISARTPHAMAPWKKPRF